MYVSDDDMMYLLYFHPYPNINKRKNVLVCPLTENSSASQIKNKRYQLLDA